MIEEMVPGEVPKVLPVPEVSRHYFPRFRFGIRRHNWQVRHCTPKAPHLLYAYHVISRQFISCRNKVNCSSKTQKAILNMAIIVSDLL